MFNREKLYEIPERFNTSKIATEVNNSVSNLIPFRLGKQLEQIYDDQEYAIYIHRSFMSSYDLIKNNLFLDGLKSIEGASLNNIALSCTTIGVFFSQLLSTYLYKFSKSCVIIKVPKAFLDSTGAKPIWNPIIDSTYKLLPEYILGVIDVYQGSVNNLTFNPNYSNYHDYESNDLVFDEIIAESRVNLRHTK